MLKLIFDDQFVEIIVNTLDISVIVVLCVRMASRNALRKVDNFYLAILHHEVELVKVSVNEAVFS